MSRYVIVALLSFSVFVSPAHAGRSAGQVTQIIAHEGDVVMFSSGFHQDKPLCSTVGEDWALSLSTQAGKAMYALVLSAHAQGKPINVIGSGTCAAWGDREAPRYVYISE